MAKANRGHRRIVGLKWAKAAPQGPWGTGRARGVKADGLRYERQLAKALGEHAWHGQWFHFEDVNGTGWCQPDIMIRGHSGVLVIECKLTWFPEAKYQITDLYAPVVELALGTPVYGLVACKNLVGRLPTGTQLVSSVLQALPIVRAGREAVLNWRGDWMGHPLRGLGTSPVRDGVQSSEQR